MKTCIAFFFMGLLAVATMVSADEVRILSLTQNGSLTWTNATLNVPCRVEWASTAEGPWFSSWDSLTNILVTNAITTRSVPMFYRVVATIPAAPLITNISPASALSLISSHWGETNFVILDVRTPGEYTTGHIKSAVNLNYYDASFTDALKALDKNKIYFVYCGSGTRSGKATDLMRNLNFSQVYNMLSGFSTFAALSGAAPYLEP